MRISVNLWCPCVTPGNATPTNPYTCSINQSISLPVSLVLKMVPLSHTHLFLTLSLSLKETQTTTKYNTTRNQNLIRQLFLSFLFLFVWPMPIYPFYYISAIIYLLPHPTIFLSYSSSSKKLIVDELNEIIE